MEDKRWLTTSLGVIREVFGLVFKKGWEWLYVYGWFEPYNFLYPTLAIAIAIYHKPEKSLNDPWCGA